MTIILTTAAIFLLTLTLVLIKPKGLNEAWAAVIGGALMLLLHAVTPVQAVRTILSGGSVLLFLLGLLILSSLLKESGFFEWSAAICAGIARGSGKTLYRNVFILGSVTTILLSLDTTAVILTPIVLALVRRMNLKPRSFILTCAFVANTASLLLPVSNLTNLIFVNSFHWNFISYAERMALPQFVCLMLNYYLFTKIFAEELPRDYDLRSIPDLNDILTNRPFFNGAAAVLCAVLIGYFVGPLFGIQPYVFALVGAAMLFGWGIVQKAAAWTAVRNVSWSIFPFMIGLFIVVRGVENIGLAGLASKAIAWAGHSEVASVFVTTFGAAIGSNIVNNIPMALLSITATAHGGRAGQYGALLGCNLGPNLTVFGSLATMLVITSARSYGEVVGAKEFLVLGLKVTPLLLTAAAVSLILTFRV